MENLIKTLKQISPEWLVYSLSEISIDMFRKQEWVRDIEVPVLYKGRLPRTLITPLSSWDIQELEYLSIRYSNDYRHANKQYKVEHIIDLYRNFENKKPLPQWVGESDIGIFGMIFGMAQEQFLYQNQAWIFEMYNRNYHLLVASPNINRPFSVSIEEIIQQTFQLSTEEFIAVLVIVFWLCSEHPDPLSAPETYYKKRQDSIISKDKIERIIKYYSCSYDDIRISTLEKQIFYTKPFIKTSQHEQYFASNLYLVLMMIANSMYWLIRDFYFKKRDKREQQIFVNAFGTMFEDYLKELAEEYCFPNQWNIVPKGKKKGADFIFDFGKSIIIVEQKSTLLGLSFKQQVPDSKPLIKFRNNIEEAYEQLNSTHETLIQLKMYNKPILKIILLYENIINLGLAEKAVNNIFETDRLCFISTISEFEILLYLLKTDSKILDSVISAMLENSNALPYQRISLSKIFTDLDLYKFHHFTGSLDYFESALNNLKHKI